MRKVCLVITVLQKYFMNAPITPQRDFPKELLIPITTAMGKMYPRPRTRFLLEDLQSTQKRIAYIQEVAIPNIRRNASSKKQAEQRYEMFKKEFRDLRLEEEEILGKLKKNPITPEQMMPPDADITYCCKAIPGLHDDKLWCPHCGKEAVLYKRLNKEDWGAEYRSAMEDREKDRKELLAKKAEMAKELEKENKEEQDEKPSGYVPWA